MCIAFVNRVPLQYEINIIIIPDRKNSFRDIN